MGTRTLETGHQCDGNCPYVQVLQTEQNFRQNLLTIVTDVQTKMNLLVGVDGNGGRVKEIDTRVDELEKAHDKQWGFITAVSLFWTVGIAVWEHFRK
jgi:hypothetical protein